MKSLVKTCPTCGKEYKDPKHPDRIYCSNDCRPHIDHVEVICLNCGKTFMDRKHPGRKYCSNECNIQAHRKTQCCVGCGKEFTATLKEFRNGRKHCTQRCAYDHATHPSDPTKKSERVCKHCGKTFECWAYRTNKYCSKRCKSDDSRIPGAVQYRGENWQGQRYKALKRDGYKCQICGKVRKPKQKYVVSVHHIRPYRLYNNDYEQANNLSNLITLCNDCHRKVESGKLACPVRLL